MNSSRTSRRGAKAAQPNSQPAPGAAAQKKPTLRGPLSSVPVVKEAPVKATPKATIISKASGKSSETTAAEGKAAVSVKPSPAPASSALTPQQVLKLEEEVKKHKDWNPSRHFRLKISTHMGKEFNVRELTIRAWIDNFVKTNQAKAAAAAEAPSTKPQSFKPTVVNPASQVRPAPAVIKLEKVQPQAQLVPKDNSEDVECIDIISDDDDESVTVGESAQSRSAELWQEQIRDLENKFQQSSNSEVEQL